MKTFTCELLHLMENNIRPCVTAPDEYILFQNKHIPSGAAALSRKFKVISDFAEKIHGECRATSQPFIRGDELRMTFWLVGDVVDMKKFDARLEGGMNNVIY